MLEILKTSGFWYLASPYSHPDPKVRADRAADVLILSGKLLAAGIHVYSPIHATHLASVEHRLPPDHVWWLNFNKAFIDPAVGVLIAGIPGWQVSKGVKQEIAYAHQRGKEVYLIDEYEIRPFKVNPPGADQWGEVRGESKGWTPEREE